MTVIVSGKRKSAIAKAIICEGKGKISVNNKDYKNLQMFDKLKIEEPLRIYQDSVGKINFDVEIQIRGGGEKGQIDAARLALAKAIVEFSKNEQVEKKFLEYDRSLLVADIRRKEVYKPGDSRARAKRQASKR